MDNPSAFLRRLRDTTINYKAPTLLSLPVFLSFSPVVSIISDSTQNKLKLSSPLPGRFSLSFVFFFCLGIKRPKKTERAFGVCDVNLSDFAPLSLKTFSLRIYLILKIYAFFHLRLRLPLCMKNSFLD